MRSKNAKEDRYYVNAIVSPSLRNGIWRYKRRERYSVSEAVESLLLLGIAASEQQPRRKRNTSGV